MAGWGLVFNDNEDFDYYKPSIYNGTDFIKCKPYVYREGQWVLCGGGNSILIPLKDSDGNYIFDDNEQQIFVYSKKYFDFITNDSDGFYTADDEEFAVQG